MESLTVVGVRSTYSRTTKVQYATIAPLLSRTQSGPRCSHGSHHPVNFHLSFRPCTAFDRLKDTYHYLLSSNSTASLCLFTASGSQRSGALHSTRFPAFFMSSSQDKYQACNCPIPLSEAEKNSYCSPARNHVSTSIISLLVPYAAIPTDENSCNKRYVGHFDLLLRGAA